MVETLTSFYLGDWYVNTRTNELLKGHIQIKLEAKVMQVLQYLALHGGELVTREELEQCVWGNTVVGYDALTGCIAKLRKILDDDARQPAYIETISKKGYRLICKVNTDHAGHGHRPDNSAARLVNQHRLSILAGLSVLIVVVISLYMLNSQSTHASLKRTNTPVIVVLPFSNLVADASQDYFNEGMTADITTALSKLSGVMVISPASAKAFATRASGFEQIAKAFGVNYILQGSVRRLDNKVRVNVSLVDASSNLYLWSEKYDREWRSIFDVEDEITSRIIETLSIELTRDEKRRTAQRYTRNLDAYEDFLRGQSLYMHHEPDDNLQAREYFQQAILRDENFARAYSSMALTYVSEHRYGWSRSAANSLDQALALATRGTQLDKELPQAYWVLAYVHLFRQDYEQAAVVAQQSIELEPNFADSYISLAVSKMHSGQAQEALLLVKKAMLLNPKYPAAYLSVLGQLYYFMADYEAAVVALSQAVERNPNLITAQVFQAVAFYKLRRYEEADWSMQHIKINHADFSLAKLNEMLPLIDESVIRDIKKYLQLIAPDV